MFATWIRPIFLAVCLSITTSATKPTDILIEGEVKGINRVWILNPITMKPLRLLLSIKLKVHEAQALKRTPILDDRVQLDHNVTSVGKGYRLEPKPAEEVTPEVQSEIQRLLNKKRPQSFDWSGGREAEEFLINARGLLNRFKGGTKFRGVYTMGHYNDVNGEHLYTYISPVEITHNEKTYQDGSYEELLTRDLRQRENFKELWNL